MKYMIYLTWKDNDEDSYEVKGAKQRDKEINFNLHDDDFKSIAYAPIHADGTVGEKVYKKWSYEIF